MSLCLTCNGAPLETNGPEHERDQPKYPVQTQLSACCQRERSMDRENKRRGKKRDNKNMGTKIDEIKSKK